MTLSDSGAAAAAPADDLRADLEAAFAPTEPETPGMGHNGGPEMDAERTAPTRDERTGRFASQKAEEDGEQPAEAATETQDEARQPEGASKPERLAPPEGWPSDAKLAWDKLPKAAQEALRADLDAGRLSLGGLVQGNTAPDPVRETLKTYEQDIARRGVPPEHAVKALFEAQRILDADPVAGLQWLARSYGVDPASLAPKDAQQSQQQGYADPMVAQLQQEVSQLKGILTQQQRQQHDAMLAEQQRAIDTFATEKAADGSPLRPFFNEVRVTMGRLMQAGEARDLADAYDKAVWARPDLRTRLLDQERKAEATKREAEQRAAADKAKKLAVSVRSNPSVSAGPAPADDLRGELMRAWG